MIRSICAGATAASAVSLAVLLLMALWPGMALAQPQTGQSVGQAGQSVNIGYVELEADPRYRNNSAYAGIVYRSLGRPLPGAQVGLDDARMIGRVTGTDFALKTHRAESVGSLIETVRQWSGDEGIHFVLADLPGAALDELAEATAELPLLLFNVSAADDRLRGKDCHGNLAHTFPSHSMMTDALVQYLVSKKWDQLLVLKGAEQADSDLVRALRKSTEKFGAEIVAERDFSLSKNPRERNQNNIALLTGEARYDTVFVADSRGEFGRYVPYQIQQPRPVVGTSGLGARAWHWSWYRHGAPQLQHRFEALATPRRMNSASWAAWVAVKAIAQAALRSDPNDYGAMRSFILGDQLNLDGAKGNPGSFRSWNQQLRQPLLLTSAEAVIARAPLREFMHQRNRLDTLGADEHESECELPR